MALLESESEWCSTWTTCKLLDMMSLERGGAIPSCCCSFGDDDVSPVGGTRLITPGLSRSSAAVSGRLAEELWLLAHPAELRELVDPPKWGSEEVVAGPALRRVSALTLNLSLGSELS